MDFCAIYNVIDTWFTNIWTVISFIIIALVIGRIIYMETPWYKNKPYSPPQNDPCGNDNIKRGHSDYM